MKKNLILKFILLLILTVIQARSLADTIQQQLTCPVCNIEYAAVFPASDTTPLCLDGRPASGKIVPVAECPLCHGVFADADFSSSEISRLKSYLWQNEYKTLKNSAAERFALILEHLERENHEIAQAWLKAAWLANTTSERRHCLEKARKAFMTSLTDTKHSPEKEFEIMIKIADLARQLGDFAAAGKTLDQMSQKPDFRTGWFPLVIRFCRELADKGNIDPAPLPRGNALHAAIENNDFEKASQLAKSDTLLNELDAMGRPPLLEAISLKRETIVAWLLKAGASVSQTDINGNTALHQAVLSGNLQLLEKLLPLAKNLDPANNNGSTPLLLAAETGRVVIIKRLLEAGADFNRKDARGNTILHILSAKPGQGREIIAANLASRFRDVNIRNFDDYTPLHLAARVGNLAVISALIKAGARIDARLPDGSTALFFCKPVITSNLLGLGADIEARNNAGHTAMVHARLNADKERMTFLKRTGRFGSQPVKFYINARATNIFYAVENSDHEAIREIIRRDPGQLAAKEAEVSETPLHRAAAGANPQTVQLLINLGASLDATNEFMRTPMHYAAAAGNLEIVKTLHTAGANIHAVDIRGSTPLHDAATTGHRKVYIYLLELDASDTTRDNDGKTPAELFAGQQ